MKALTVQQPWASAMVHPGITRGGLVKDVENRTQMWRHRGPLAIHAGQRVSQRGLDSPLIAPPHQRNGPHVTQVDGDARVWWRLGDGTKWGCVLPLGKIIGVVDLVDVHTAVVYQTRDRDDNNLAAIDCCQSPWAESGYTEHGGRQRRDVVHLVLEHPRPLTEPIPCKGRLGLWTPPAEVLIELGAVA